MRVCTFFLKRFTVLTGVVGSPGMRWLNRRGPFISTRSIFSKGFGVGAGAGLLSLVRKLLRVETLDVLIWLLLSLTSWFSLRMLCSLRSCSSWKVWSRRMLCSLL